jgi:rhamnosyltransferase
MNAAHTKPDAHSPRESPGSIDVAAVVVTLNPDLVIFDALLAATCAQVDRIFVIDNGSREDVASEIARLCGSRAELHTLSYNIGVAAAQNRGIARAKEAGAARVLLLDHDSVPAQGMVDALRAASAELGATGMSVGAVGPLIVDRQSRLAAPLPQIVDGTVRFLPAPSSQPTECEYLIASGSLIPIGVLDRVGLMDEAYFVDQVDIEWCLRARQSGFAMYCAPLARLDHMIGDEVVSFWLFGRREIAVHSPLRDYFYFRNSLRLIRRKNTARPWRRFWARRLVRLLVVQSLFVPPRMARARAMFKGIADALRQS